MSKHGLPRARQGFPGFGHPRPIPFQEGITMSLFIPARWLAAATLSFAAIGAAAQAPKAPQTLIKEVSTDVLDAVKADKSIQAGDLNKVIVLVDQKVLPYVDFERMTSSAVGRYWRQATPEQQKRLQEE
ncbi:MAG: ABC transporter substrate-binding protein, partial [Caldimonas sp.]